MPIESCIFAVYEISAMLHSICNYDNQMRTEGFAGIQHTQTHRDII